MITEKQAISMIEDELPANELKILQIKQMNEFMEAYANRMVCLAESGELKKFEIQLSVSNRLFSEGSREIRNAMQTSFASCFCELFSRKPELLALVRKNLRGVEWMLHNHSSSTR